MSQPPFLPFRASRAARGGPVDGPSRRRRRGTVAAGALLSGALLISGCGSDDSGGDGGGGDAGSESSAAQAKVLHKVPMAKVPELTGAMGMWTTSDNFVKTDLKKIVGYPVAGGKSEWEIPLDGEVCWASPEPTEDGLVAVVFQNDKADSGVCTEVGLVDLNKGKLRWQKQGVDADGLTETFREVTIGDGAVVATGTGGSAAWSTDGTVRWRPGADRECSDEGYAGSAAKLVSVVNCGDLDNPRYEVRTVDAKTRTPKSSYKLPEGTEYAHVASVEPLVVAVDDGDAPGGSGVSRFLSIDDGAAEGKLLSKVDMAGGKHGKYEPECPATEVTDCRQLAVSKDTLFLSTSKPGKSGSEATNDIVGISLKTGKETGRAEGVDTGRMVPVGFDEKGRLLAYQESNIMSEEGGAVWQIDPESYKKTKLLQNPSSGYEMESRFETDRRVLFTDGRLYLGADHVSEPSDVYKTKQPLAVVLGAK